MYGHDNKFYDYNTALDLKYGAKEAIAEKHNTKQVTMNLVFDTVQDAGGFSKSVFQKREQGKVYKVQKNFLSPRSGDGLPHDYSDKCIIL